jgi:hypothetical protein
MHEPSRGEASLLEKHEADPPGPLLNWFSALTAFRLPARRALGSIHSLEAPMLGGRVRGAPERVTLGHSIRSLGERLEDWLGTPKGGAQRVEPERHLAIGVWIWQTLAEALLALGDDSAAGAALGAAAGSCLEDMWHLSSPRVRLN